MSFVPEGWRVKLATRSAFDLGNKQRQSDAAELLREVAASVKDPARTELMAMAAERSLRSGVIPDDIDDQVRAVLALADLTAHDSDRNRLLGQAAVLAFHRLRHLDSAISPITEDTAAFLQPLRTSSAWRGLTAARRPDRTSDLPPARMRVVVVVDDDTRFIEPMIAAIRAADSFVDFRVVQLRQWAKTHNLTLPLNPHQQIAARADSEIDKQPWARALHDELDDADVVWVEWCQRAAVLVSLLDLAPRRVIIRLHSFEAFTVFPHLVDPSAVDVLVTVSPTFAKLSAAVVPELGAKSAYVPNAVDLKAISKEKAPSAKRTLGLVGWSAPAKDASWALDVLELLRQTDPNWTIRLVGSPPDASASEGVAQYARRIDERLDRLGAAVTQTGQVDDVAHELKQIGVIVSSSTRESFHLALAEGVASGAVPVVRDWPSLRKFGGAHDTWPAEWIVRSPEEAVHLINEGQDIVDADAYIPDPQQAAALMLQVLRGTNVR
jgi:glycosyltransferase involved in cell wall biosynthesis